ncbi:hypothetical protein [Natrinema amylolyticum]|uniref:hypothetical protein n=1 Tax=Natrinema amylolyticum TaxID=2878679 RepID=UPI001CFBD52A|nr:hypothetical protein [Natrinema amylolyticum]
MPEFGETVDELEALSADVEKPILFTVAAPTTPSKTSDDRWITSEFRRSIRRNAVQEPSQRSSNRYRAKKISNGSERASDVVPDTESQTETENHDGFTIVLTNGFQ